MADSTQLLSQVDLAESKSTPPPNQKHLSSLDSRIEQYIGDFGWSQFLQAVLVSMAWIFDGQQTFITIFTDARPTWHCTDQLGDEWSSSCDSVSNICRLPKNSWTWDWPAHTSIISEWSLECAASIVTGLPASSFFMGCLVGGFVLATLADSSLGRKNMLFLTCLTMSLSSLLTIFSINIWIYSALRFVCGFFRSTIGTCSLVLATELVGKRWRGQVGVMGFFCFTLGFLSLPAMAYMNIGLSWRYLYLYTSIPGIIYSALVRLFVRESPRWLFVRGREEEAMATLKSIANHSNLTWSFSGLSSFEQETGNDNIFSAMKILLEKRWALRRLSAIMVMGFGMGMVYYGMPLGLGDLAFNLYLSVTFNALSELPSSLVTFFLVGKLNRKSSIIVFTSLSGVCSIICGLKGGEWRRLQIGVELVSFFSACTATDILFIFTIELFPTLVRNSALSMVRQAVVLGGVFSPMLVAAGRGDGFSPYTVFGLVIGCCGLFALCLPETRGRALCDTMEEEEEHNEKAACNGVGDV
ncbi:organic cation/carnitine transporter 3-like [Corylus avellana]|uniref:organic cation/carnitine transporter 3-like n=1 Tax=Corylus avellana TaxID=13451 RepID=UPI001E22234E|nr:organic cation/carnitine transporter 3-like [Corylus avellana]